MKCIILGDKYEKGMKSKGCSGLLPVNTKVNLLEHQYKTIKKAFPNCQIIYIYGYESKKINDYFKKKDCNIQFVKNELYEDTGYATSLNLANQYMDGDCFILSGNIKYSSKSLQEINRKNSQIIVNTKQPYKLGCSVDENMIADMIVYGADNYLTNCYFVKKHDIDIMKFLLSDKNNLNNFIFEIVNKMIEHGVEFEINNTNSKNKFQKYILK